MHRSGLGPGAAVRALITGGSGGLGFAIARALASGGMQVVATYAHHDEVASRAREAADRERLSVTFERCDATSSDAVTALITRIGSPDVLVHAAGFTRDHLLLTMSDRDIDDILAVHLTGGFLAARSVMPGMIARAWGRVVFVVSPTALVGRRGQTNYAAAKSGLIGLCRALAREAGPSGVTVNCVSAGLTDTALTKDLPPETRDEILRAVPLGRAGNREEVAALVAFVCSDAAAYITGQVLSADGGLT